MLLLGKSTISMVIFNSYVKLPEGIGPDREVLGALAGHERFFDDTYPYSSHILWHQEIVFIHN